MKKILVYGDSNVWGDNFDTGIRIKDEYQWVNILQEKVKNKYKIFQEGLPGRLAGKSEKIKKYKNGKDTFISTFRTNAPVDIIIIALGTNDLQIKYNNSSKDVIDNLLWYNEVVKEQFEDIEDRVKYFVDSKMPRFVYIMPPNFDYLDRAKEIFDKSSEKKRQEIINYFNKNNYEVLIPTNMELSDGIHFNKKDHIKIAELVEKVL